MRRITLATSWGELILVGGSRAGEGTVVVLPQMRLALDAGFPLRALVPVENVVVSHGHADHLAALLPWAAQRQLQNLGPATIFAGEPLASQIRQLLVLGALMENGQPYQVQVRQVEPGEELQLRGDMSLRFFRTSHWTPTLGSLLLGKKRQLKPTFAGLPQEEIRQLRAQGVKVAETVEIPILAYLADTGPEVFHQQPWLADAEVLVVECTFLSPKDRERAQRFGHIHLQDLARYLVTAHHRHVILTHLSRRHRLNAGSRAMKRALAKENGPRLHFLNVEWP